MTRDVAVGADTAFAFLSDLRTLRLWTMTRWELVSDMAATGVSGVDGSTLHVVHDIDAVRRAVWFTVTDAGGGPSRALLAVRVIDGSDVDVDGCRITLVAWRPARFDDARWAAVHAAHVAEVDALVGELAGRT